MGEEVIFYKRRARSRPRLGVKRPDGGENFQRFKEEKRQD